MLQGWWRKYVCCSRRNRRDVLSTVPNNFIFTSYEQVWPPIPRDWKYIRSSYINKDISTPYENETSNRHMFMIVLFIDAETLTLQQEKINHLQDVIDYTKIFSDSEEFTNFFSNTTNHTYHLITSLTLKDELIPLVEHQQQILEIHILCDRPLVNEQHLNHGKTKYISFDNVEALTNLLVEEKRRYTNMTFTSISANQLDSSFMYSILLKEILLELEYDDETAKQDFVDYCRYEYGDNSATLRTINRFEYDYCQDRVFYWYSQPCFFFELLNRSLRNQDIEILIRMTFILRHLDKQIEHLHSTIMSSRSSACFHVYRGQGMHRKEFDSKIRNKVGGLLSFNSFLSTSENVTVAEMFVLRNDPDSVAVLFDITVDGSMSRCPYAALAHNSSIADEEEILFSIHSLFRIQSVEENLNDNIWHVNLAMTHENDQQLHALTDYMRKRIEGLTGWSRLENLLMEMGKWKMVKPLIEVSLESSLRDENQRKQAFLHHQLGVINTMLADNTTAIEHYKKSLAIRSPTDFLGLALSHNGIGSALEKQGHLLDALNEYKCALSLINQLDPIDIEAVSAVRNNIAGVLRSQGKLLEALHTYEECLELEVKYLPALHPNLANTYANIAMIYDDLNEHETALRYEFRALDIEQHSLPFDHPSLAITHSNIALTLHALNRTIEAVSHLQQTVDILTKTLISDDPLLLQQQTLLKKLQRALL